MSHQSGKNGLFLHLDSNTNGTVLGVAYDSSLLLTYGYFFPQPRVTLKSSGELSPPSAAGEKPLNLEILLAI